MNFTKKIRSRTSQINIGLARENDHFYTKGKKFCLNIDQLFRKKIKKIIKKKFSAQIMINFFTNKIFSENGFQYNEKFWGNFENGFGYKEKYGVY